jgi:WhiB family transcriptional regulator, redox-sensing transcriptional regulator
MRPTGASTGSAARHVHRKSLDLELPLKPPQNVTDVITIVSFYPPPPATTSDPGTPRRTGEEALMGPILPVEIQPWYEKAACLDKDADCFFPEKGGSTRAAKRICQTCSVQAECLDYALDNDERFGIWGGLSERERRRLKRRAS